MSGLKPDLVSKTVVGRGPLSLLFAGASGLFGRYYGNKAAAIAGRASDPGQGRLEKSFRAIPLEIEKATPPEIGSR